MASMHFRNHSHGGWKSYSYRFHLIIPRYKKPCIGLWIYTSQQAPFKADKRSHNNLPDILDLQSGHCNQEASVFQFADQL